MKSFTVGGKRKREPHLLDYLGCYHRQGLRRGTCVSTIANLLLGDNHSLQSVEAAISIFDRYMATSTRVFSTDDDLVKVCLVCAMLATKVHERYFLNLGNFENITPKQARQLEVDILLSLEWKLPHEGLLLHAIDDICPFPNWDTLTPWLQHAWKNDVLLRSFPNNVLAASILEVAGEGEHGDSCKDCVKMLTQCV